MTKFFGTSNFIMNDKIYRKLMSISEIITNHLKRHNCRFCVILDLITGIFV